MNQELLRNISKNQFEKLLRTAISNNYLLFDGIVYQQINKAAMCFPLGPSLTNAFLAHVKQIWLNDCSDELKPVYYKRYVDDIFVLFQSPHYLEKFATTICHKPIFSGSYSNFNSFIADEYKYV